MLTEDESDGTFSFAAPPPSNPFSPPGDDNASGGGEGSGFDAFGVGVGDGGAPVSMMPSLQQALQVQQQQQQSQFQVQQQQQGGMGDMGGMNGMMPSPSGNWPPPPPPQPQQQQQQYAHGYGQQQPPQHQQQYQPSLQLTDAVGNAPASSFLSRVTSCMSIESHQQHFDVNTVDVWERIKGAVKYCAVVDGFRNEVLRGGGAVAAAAGVGDEGSGASDPSSSVGVVGARPGKGPDLYGPAWITMTLAFLVAVTSNASMYFHHSRTAKDESSEADFDYDINHLLRATSILYAFSFGLPSVLWVVFRILGVVALGFVELVCLYGYSLVPFIPAVIICVAPVNWIDWTALGIATAVSGMLVLKNVTGPILDSDEGGRGKKAGPLIMCVLGCHFVFYVVFKLAFYHHV